MEKIVLAELDIDTQKLISASMETRQALSDLRNEQKELKKQGLENSAQYIRNAAEIQRLTPIVNAQTKALASQVNEAGKLTAATESLTDAVARENLTEQEYLDNNKRLYALRKDLNKQSEDYQKNLDAVNAKINENNAYLEENGSAMDKLKMNIGNYREGITGAFQDLNIMNGGLLGFVERAQQVGGVGPLVMSSLKGIATGIGGITKASLTFLATPIGAVIGAIGLVLGLVINYLKSTQEGIDAVTAVTRPLQAILSALMGVLQKVGKAMFEAFSNPKKLLMDLVDFVKGQVMNRLTAFGEVVQGIINLDFKRVVDGALQGATGVKGMTDKIANAANATKDFLSDAAKKGQEIDRLQKEIEKGQLALNRNKIEYNNLIEAELDKTKDSSLSFKEREAASRRIIAINQQMGEEEEAIIKNKIEKLKLEQSLRAVTREEQQEMIDLETELDEAQDRGHDAQLEQMKIISGARKEAKAQALEYQKQVLDDALAKLKLEYDIFIQLQGEKAKSVEEQVAYAEQIRQKEIAIAQAEFNKTKKTENDKLALTKATNDANLKFIQAQSDAVIDNADKEFQYFKDNNQSILDNNKFLNESILQQELKRMDDVATAEKDNLKVRFDAGKLALNEYNAEIARIDDENKKSQDALRQQREDADTQRRLTDLENQKAIAGENFMAQLALEQEQNEIKRQQDIANAEKSGADISLINQKYAKLEKDIEQSKNEFKYQQRANFLSGVRGLLNQESILGKALAIAEIVNSTVQNAAKAFNLANLYAANPLTLPLAINARVQGGLIIAQGAIQTAKTVGAKFGGGGLQEIGGNSHANGGTNFVGEDGTHFQAERGELIGVMSRNASRHFMAFNNMFSGGSSKSNYLANGGIVSREISTPGIDIDLLAVKIAEANSMLPAPIVGVQDIVTVANKQVKIKQMTQF